MSNQIAESSLDALQKLGTGWTMEGAADREWDALFEKLLTFMTNDERIDHDHRPCLSDLAAEYLAGLSDPVNRQ